MSHKAIAKSSGFGVSVVYQLVIGMDSSISKRPSLLMWPFLLHFASFCCATKITEPRVGKSAVSSRHHLQQAVIDKVRTAFWPNSLARQYNRTKSSDELISCGF